MEIASLLVSAAWNGDDAERGLDRLDSKFKKSENSSQQFTNAINRAGERLRDARGRFGASGQAAEEYSKSVHRSALTSSLFAGAAGGLVTLLGSSLTSALKSGASALLTYSARLEQAKIGFTTLLGSSKAAESHLKQLQNFAMKTPFQFEELIVASRRFQAMGVNAKEVVPLLTAVGNAVSAAGGGSEVVDRVSLAIAQMGAKGKVSADELLQLSEAGINGAKILSQELGITVAKVLELSEKGEISSDVFISAFKKFSQQNFGGAMEKQSRTFLGAFSTIKDTLKIEGSKAFEPFYEAISQITVRTSKEMQGLSFGDAIEKAIEASFESAGTTVSISVQGMFRDIEKEGLQQIEYLPEKWGNALSRGLFGNWNVADWMTGNIDKGTRVPFESMRPTKPTWNVQRDGDSMPLSSAPSRSNLADQLGGASSQKQLEKTRDIITDLQTQLEFFGNKSQVAATKQRLLSAGVTDLNGSLAQQAIALAGVQDKLLRQSELAEAERQRVEDRNKSLSNEADGWMKQATEQALDLLAASRGGRTELEKLTELFSRMKVSGSFDDSYFEPFIEQAKRLDEIKFSNLAEQQIQELNDRITELSNTTEDGIDPLIQYEQWVKQQGGAARFSTEELKKLSLAFLSVGDAQLTYEKKRRGKSLNDEVSIISRGALRELKELTPSGRKEKNPLEELFERFEDIKDFKLAPGAFAPIFDLLKSLDVKTADGVGKNTEAISAAIRVLLKDADVAAQDLNKIVDGMVLATQRAYDIGGIGEIAKSREHADRLRSFNNSLFDIEEEMQGERIRLLEVAGVRRGEILRRQMELDLKVEQERSRRIIESLKRERDNLPEIESNTNRRAEVEEAINRQIELQERSSLARRDRIQAEFSERQNARLKDFADDVTDVLMSGFDDGWRGILDGFKQMLLQMSADLIRSQLFKGLKNITGGTSPKSEDSEVQSGRGSLLGDLIGSILNRGGDKNQQQPKDTTPQKVKEASEKGVEAVLKAGDANAKAVDTSGNATVGSLGTISKSLIGGLGQIATLIAAGQSRGSFWKGLLGAAAVGAVNGAIGAATGGGGGGGFLSGLFGGGSSGGSPSSGHEGGHSFATGGFVSGEGTGTSDSIRAWLSNGEGVITARATSFYGGRAFIDALNRMDVPKFATGGMVGDGGFASGYVPPIPASTRRNETGDATRGGARQGGNVTIEQFSINISGAKDANEVKRQLSSGQIDQMMLERLRRAQRNV